MRISKREVREFNTTNLIPHVYKHGEEVSRMNWPAGREPCRLLAYMACQMSGAKIAEIGIRHGTCSIALACNLTNTVDCYDVHYPYVEECRERIRFPNIQFFYEDLLEDKNIHKTLDYDLIFLDVDPHDGVKERIWSDYWIKHDYKGTVVCDDILHNYWPELAKWWDSITITKYDVTDIGHLSGTGIIDFSGKVEIIND